MNGDITYPFYDTPSIPNIRPQTFDADLLPIEFCLVRIGEISRRSSLPHIRNPFALDDTGLRQNTAVAADTLEPA